MEAPIITFRAVVVGDTPYLAVPDVVSALSLLADATDEDGSDSTAVRVAIGNLLSIGLRSLAEADPGA